MKFLLLFVLILGVSASQSPGRDEARLQGFPQLGGSISDIIIGIVKKLIDTVKGVIPDPISLPKINITLPYENMANGSFIITDLIEIGAKNFNTSSVNVYMTNLTMNVVLDVPSININTNYFSDLLFGSIVPMYGEGPANIRLKNLRLNISSTFKFEILKLKLQTKNTTIFLNLGDAVFDIHGMLNNEAFSILVSQILDDTVNVFINKHQVLISNILGPIVESVINSILSGKKVNEAFVNNAPIELDDGEVMKLRSLFMDGILKHPQVSKFVSV